jgi:hypothetical protein
MQPCTIIHLVAINILQPRLGPLVQQIRHLKPRPVRVQARRRSLAVPGPLLLELRRQVVLEHLHNVLAEHREELVAVEGAAGSDVQALGAGVGRDDEVGGSGECVPVAR